MTDGGSTSVSLDQRSQDVVDGLVRDGRYASAEEVVREGLRLVEANEAKLAALREHIQRSIAEGGEYTDEEAAAAIEDALAYFEARRERV